MRGRVVRRPQHVLPERARCDAGGLQPRADDLDLERRPRRDDLFHRRRPRQLAIDHRAVRAQQERRQDGRDVRERQHVRMEVDAERVGHEPPPRLDPPPGRRVAGGELGAERRVGEGDAVLDVRREVRRARRRDDVDLHRHPGAELDRRARPDRRVDPLVEVELVARVEEDAEERVAQVAVDDGLERPAGLADVQRLDTTRRRPRSTGRPAGPRSRAMPSGSSAASSTTKPARQVSAPQIPNAVVNRSPRSIARSLGLSRPERRPRARGEHHVAGQRHPVPAEQARRPRIRAGPDGGRAAAAGRRSRSRRRPLEGIASWSTSLMIRSPSAGSMSRALAFSTLPPDPAARAARRRCRPAARSVARSSYAFQPRTPTRLPAPDALAGRGSPPAAATGRAAGSAG